MLQTDPPLTLFLDQLAFPESPRWHDGALWFSDFHTRRVQRADMAGRCETLVTVPGQPSGLGWLPDGRLLIVSMTDRRLLRVREGGEVTHRIATPAQAVACTLGGPDRRTLFVLTTKVMLPAEQSLQSRPGAIHTVAVTVPGVGRP